MINWLKGKFRVVEDKETRLQHAEFDLDENTAKLMVNHPDGMMLAASLVNMLIELDAENYLEVRFWHEPTDELYSCLIQRVNGKTPAEKNAELERHNGLLRSIGEAAIEFIKAPQDLQEIYSRHDAIESALKAAIEGGALEDT